MPRAARPGMAKLDFPQMDMPMRRSRLLPLAALALATVAAVPVQTGKWDVTVHPNAIPLPPEIEKGIGCGIPYDDDAARNHARRPETRRPPVA